MHPRTKVWGELRKLGNTPYCYQGVSDETFVPEHQHRHGQLIYTEGGRVHVMLDSKVWYLPARHYMWIPPRANHALQISVPSVKLWMLYFPMGQKEPSFYTKPGIYGVNNLLLELLYYTTNFGGSISKKMEDQFHVVSAIKALLPKISKNKLPFDLPIPTDSRLKEITTYIQNNLADHIKVKDIVAHFDLSESTLTRLFKRDLKMSFKSYLETLRMISAIELITAGGLSIKEVCFRIGYGSVPSFSNLFKKIVGTRPTAYQL